jgi:hypothetical protein
MKDTLATLAFGGLMTLLILMAVIDLSPKSHKNIVETALKECEKSLPRDQHCVIVALPVSKE